MKDRSIAPRAWLGGVLATSAILYSRALGNDFVYDDRYTIVTNRHLAAWSFVWKSLVSDAFWFADLVPGARTPLYRPAFDLWLWLNFHLFGLHPAGWHAAEIALHLLAAWLLYRVASRLTADPWTGAAAASIFALLPLHAEAVVWSSAASLLLSAAFELGALACYLRGDDPAADSPRVDRGLALGLFGCALLSHESAIALPVLIAVHAILRKEHKFYMSYRTYAATCAAVWPYAAEAAVYLTLRSWVLRAVTWSGSAIPAALTGTQAALMIPGAIAREWMLFAIPWLAGPALPPRAVPGIFAPGFYLPAAGIAVVAIAAIALLRHNPHRRLYLFCAAWVLIGAAPLASLSTFGLLVATQNRYLYFPSAGFCVVAADLAIAFARRDKRNAIAVGIGAGAFALACAIALFSVQRFWHDDVALHSHCVDNAPDSAFCRDLLAQALEARGELTRARYQFERAVALDPRGEWNAYHELARIDARLGDKAAAESAMADWVKRLTPPTLGAYAEMALAADSAGDAKGAEAALARAAAMPGGANVAALVRAQMLFRHGDSKGAAAALDELIRRDPRDAQALNVLGAVSIAENRYDEALAAYRQASAIAPDDPAVHYRIALVLHHLGRDREARGECAHAIAIAPDDRAALALMAAIGTGGVR